MKSLLEYINHARYESIVAEEFCAIESNDIAINESFKASILTKLAQKIALAEKENNKKRKEQHEKNVEVWGPINAGDPSYVSFASIFGPKTQRITRTTSKTGIQGLKWSEITDDDFKIYNPDDKELQKLVKKTYGKPNGNADFIVVNNAIREDEPIAFIKAYNADKDGDNVYLFKIGNKFGDGVKALQKSHYTYQVRPYKVNEVIELLNTYAKTGDIKVYALEITDDMIKSYQTLHTDRKENQKGIINYDKKSLEELLKNQKARYQALIKEMRIAKLQKDPDSLFNRIVDLQKEVNTVALAIMKSPENLDKGFNLGQLLYSCNHAYESYYWYVKDNHEGDKEVKAWNERNPDNKREKTLNHKEAERRFEQCQEHIKDAEKLLEQIKSELQ